MSTVVVGIGSSAPSPVRLVGNVTKSKDGSVSIAYKEPGMVRETNKSFLTSEVVAYRAGEAGFVVAMLNEPVTKVVGEMTIKDGVRHVKTEEGTVVLNSVPGVSYDVKEVEADSKEARAAERAGKVKVRGASRRAAAPAAKSSKTAAAPAKTSGKSSRAERRAAAAAAASGEKSAKVKSKKTSSTEEAPAKKKKRSAK